MTKEIKNFEIVYTIIMSAIFIEEHKLATPTPTGDSVSGPKSFKMLRLRKGPAEELGIIISKKRNPTKGTTGYIIAHIEPDGLINK